MRKHRRKTHYRQITIAAVAIGAVAVPSAAMACIDQPEDPAAQARHHQWRHTHSNDWWQTKWGQKPTGGAPEAPTAAPSAPAGSQAPTAPSAPKATASPSAPQPAAPAASGATAKVVALVNSERAKVGCSAVKVNAKLTKAAQDHSQDMAAHKNMSHTGSDGSNPGDRITRAGYSWSTYGENVAYGYSTPESVMQGWMTSPGHKANILNCSFKEIGVGLAQPGSYWTQDFGAAR